MQNAQVILRGNNLQSPGKALDYLWTDNLYERCLVSKFTLECKLKRYTEIIIWQFSYNTHLNQRPPK